MALSKLSTKMLANLIENPLAQEIESRLTSGGTMSRQLFFRLESEMNRQSAVDMQTAFTANSLGGISARLKSALHSWLGGTLMKQFIADWP